jgi:hypothetical protein
MRAYIEVELKLCSFLSLSVGVGQWSASCAGHFTPRERVSWYSLLGRLDGHQSCSGYFREEKNFLSSLGN